MDEQPVPEKPKNKVLQIFFHIVKLAIAAVLIWWVVKDISLQQLAGIPRINFVFSFASAFMFILLQSTLTAWRWKLLVEAQDLEITFFHAFSLTFQGMFFSLCLPGGAVGGDVVKAAFLAKETQSGKKIEGVTSIFADRLTGMIALFGLAVLLVLFSLPRIFTFEKGLQATIYTITLACAAGVAAALFIIFHDVFLKLKWIRMLVDWADGILKGKLKRILSSVDIYRRKWKVLLGTCVLGIFVIHPLLLLGLYSIARFITGKWQNFLDCSLAAILGNSAACIPGTIGGLGVRDKMMQSLLETAGLSGSDAGIAPIIYSLAYVAVSLTGAIFFLMNSSRKKKE